MANNQREGNDKRQKSLRGFAAMDQEKQREIASKGGRAAHAKGTAHEFTPEEARDAGRKGGETVSRNREHMAQIGREGGKQSRGGGRRRNETRNEEDNSARSGH
jgi:general stress protein YciG